MEPARQRAAPDDLLRRADHMPGIEAVVLIGSLASNTADAMSDVDAIVILAEASFADGHQQRHALHAASVPACWDQPTESVPACWDQPTESDADVAATSGSITAEYSSRSYWAQPHP
jgi:Nucleotidyltransferase domain